MPTLLMSFHLLSLNSRVKGYGRGAVLLLHSCCQSPWRQQDFRAETTTLTVEPGGVLAASQSHLHMQRPARTTRLGTRAVYSFSRWLMGSGLNGRWCVQMPSITGLFPSFKMCLPLPGLRHNPREPQIH